MLGNGNGTFPAATLYSAGANNVPYAVAAADMNGDGQPDLLVANSYSNSASILLNSGMGTFQPPDVYATGVGSQPPAIITGDVNGDGKPNLLTANNGSSTVGVLLNTTPAAPLTTRAGLPGANATLQPNQRRHSQLGLPATVAQVQAILFDATGRAVRQQVLAAAQGSARAAVPTAGLAAGLYALRLAALDALGAPAGSRPTQRLSVR